jgi:hypothetical protein
MNLFVYIADLNGSGGSVLGLLMAKKHDLSDKNFRLPLTVAVRKICTSPTGSALIN